jgi:hypothetical protein
MAEQDQIPSVAHEALVIARVSSHGAAHPCAGSRRREETGSLSRVTRPKSRIFLAFGPAVAEIEAVSPPNKAKSDREYAYVWGIYASLS